ncbi:MAG: hypothetical protein J6J78_01435 [Clostridia bacterium]|nr:hypothetical protein [Clostridia bacterium]
MEKKDKPFTAKGNGWVSCAIGSGKGKSAIWRCEKCGWEAEVSAWKPAACPRCDQPFDQYH